MFVKMAESYIDLFANANSGVLPLEEVVPTIEGLAYYIKVGSKATLYRWAEDHDEFRYALDDLKDLQGLLLQNKGLSGKTQPVITKLMLSANHGMKEKSEQDVTSGGERIQGLTVEFVRGKAKD